MIFEPVTVCFNRTGNQLYLIPSACGYREPGRMLSDPRCKDQSPLSSKHQSGTLGIQSARSALTSEFRIRRPLQVYPMQLRLIYILFILLWMNFCCEPGCQSFLSSACKMFECRHLVPNQLYARILNHLYVDIVSHHDAQARPEAAS